MLVHDLSAQSIKIQNLPLFIHKLYCSLLYTFRNCHFFMFTVEKIKRLLKFIIWHQNLIENLFFRFIACKGHNKQWISICKEQQDKKVSHTCACSFFATNLLVDIACCNCIRKKYAVHESELVENGILCMCHEIFFGLQCRFVFGRSLLCSEPRKLVYSIIKCNQNRISSSTSHYSLFACCFLKQSRYRLWKSKLIPKWSFNASQSW